MAKSVAARMNGDDYQALVFWIQACHLIREEDGIVAVEIESEDAKSMDDVVVYHEDGYSDKHGRLLKRECYQVKYHVDFGGYLRAGSLIDPSFINASSFSFLQRAFALWKQYGDEGLIIVFYSVWTLDTQDALCELVSGDDGHIRIEKLESGGPRSKFGKVRESWREHLKINEEELLRFLESLRIIQGGQKASLEDCLNKELILAGLRSVSSTDSIHPFLALARSFITGNFGRLTRERLIEACKRANLWQGQPISIRPTKRIGIRSRFLSTAGFAEWTADRLDLLDVFDERKLKTGKDWSGDIFIPVATFLEKQLQPGDCCEMWIAAHASIATAIGYVLDTKAGVDVRIRQAGVFGIEMWENPKHCTANDTMCDYITSDIAISSGENLAIALSVSHDIHDDVQSYIMRSDVKVSTLRCFTCTHCGSHSIANQEQAISMIEKVVGSIRELKRTASRTAILHLFFSMPNFMAFALGQRLKPLGTIQLYEHNFESGYGSDYMPSLQLPPKKG